jgi:hypothetical protein
MQARSSREYDPEELELFAKYREQRAEHRPRLCKEQHRCWVIEGPPAITTSGFCVGCKAKPIGFTDKHNSKHWGS